VGYRRSCFRGSWHSRPLIYLKKDTCYYLGEDVTEMVGAAERKLVQLIDHRRKADFCKTKRSVLLMNGHPCEQDRETKSDETALNKV